MRIERYLIEFKGVRSLLGELRGDRLSECCKEFLRRIASYMFELGAVRSLSGEFQSNRICRVL